MFTGDNDKWNRHWSDPAFRRVRLAPVCRDEDYVVFSDLRAFLDGYRTERKIVVLDYGAGASPYRSLFPNAEYRRADFINGPELDYLVAQDSKVKAKEATFDMILSTQVAEHVFSPQIYFAECFRLLKPGGLLISPRTEFGRNTGRHSTFSGGQPPLAARFAGGRLPTCKYLSAHFRLPWQLLPGAEVAASSPRRPKCPGPNSRRRNT